MQLGETLLVLGALIIFSISTLYLNDNKLDTSNRMIEAEFKTTASGIAQSYIEEAQVLQYDEVIISESFSALPADFTNIGSLGPDAGEVYPNFDDVDDFNGFTQTETSLRQVQYEISVQVSYADTLTFTPTFSNKSFYKLLSVTVRSPFFQDSLIYKYLYSFH